MTILSTLKTMIARHGKTVTITHAGTPTYDPATGTVTDTTQTATPKGIVSGVKYGVVNGTLVQQGDQRVRVVAADVGFLPVASDTVTIDSDVWSVTVVDTTWDAGAAISYMLYIRK